MLHYIHTIDSELKSHDYVAAVEKLVIICIMLLTKILLSWKKKNACHYASDKNTLDLSWEKKTSDFFCPPPSTGKSNLSTSSSVYVYNLLVSQWVVALCDCKQ